MPCASVPWVTSSGMEHKPARNNAGAIPLFCCCVILKYLTSIHSLKKQLERGTNCLVCIHLFNPGQVNDCLFILREASDGFSPNSNRQCFHHWTCVTRATQSWEGARDWSRLALAALDTERAQLLNDSNLPVVQFAVPRKYHLCRWKQIKAWSGYRAPKIRASSSNTENHAIYFSA